METNITNNTGLQNEFSSTSVDAIIQQELTVTAISSCTATSCKKTVIFLILVCTLTSLCCGGLIFHLYYSSRSQSEGVCQTEHCVKSGE
nr:hypothetical protein BgiMline_033074 [Biomphalaria glabrata]